MGFVQTAFARIGETPEECAKRYGVPVKTKDFDPSIVAFMRESDFGNYTKADRDYFFKNESEFIPTRVSEYKSGEWRISAFFGKFNIDQNMLDDKKKEFASGRVSGISLPWDGERVMAITFTKNDETQLEKEVIISIIKKQFEGPMGNGFPDNKKAEESEIEIKNAKNILDDANKKGNINSVNIAKEDLTYKEQLLSNFIKGITEFKDELIEAVIENFEKSRNGETVELANHKGYLIIYDNKSLKIGLDNGSGDRVALCLKRYTRAKKELEESLAKTDSKDKGSALIKETEKAMGTDGL
jgi:hypothetical protein